VDGIFDDAADPRAFWSTTNLAEALPGVPTPLSWTLWRPMLEDPADVFYLTSDELLRIDPHSSQTAVVADRRQTRADLLAVSVPPAWRGRPEVTPATQPDQAVACGSAPARIEGIGANSGTVVGPVRVVTDVEFADVQPGEILVAPVTDPSWAPIMFVAAALDVDIGGLLSHAAVVARELGIPCVMGTGDGTRRLRTGDVVRVDGHAGTVEILHPQPTRSPP
jgi:phosphohistidine swiveling domain-containing protein